MNEKIKEIMYITDEIDIPNDEYFCDTDFLADIDPRRVEKFAEMIIRACIQVVHDNTDDSVKVALAIETNFGID